MGDIIKFKRGLKAAFAAVTLNEGEPAFCTDTKELFVGDGTNKNLVGLPINGTVDANNDHVTTTGALKAYIDNAVSTGIGGDITLDGGGF